MTRPQSNQKKAIVFDIDGTLSPDISWLALTRGLGASVEEHIRIYTDNKEGRLGNEDSKRQVIELWRSTGNANKRFFANLFKTMTLRPDARLIVDKLHGRYIPCLITGSMDLYAEIVADKLGIEHWYANTTLHWDEKGQLTDMDYELRQAAKKLDQFAEFCTKHNLQPQDCIVIGNGDNDLGLFKLSGNGILVLDGENSDECRQFAWKITPDLATIEQILTEYQQVT